MEETNKGIDLWRPHVRQAQALMAIWADELFFGGARGGGKSEFILADFLQDVNRYKTDWKGILFRKTYPELQELISRSQSWFPATGATYHIADKQWIWENGASLKFRHLESSSDASHYQGHEFSWIGFDEITNWASPEAYHLLKACLRGKCKAKRIRATGNPGGVGHGWVKSYFIDHNPKGFEPYFDRESNTMRMFIPSKIEDNPSIMINDPNYVNRLKGVGSESVIRAWLYGDWNVIQGSYFPEFGSKHIIRPFEIPKTWLKVRAFDWGSYHPFAVGWFAISDGTGGYPVNSIVMYREWYGCKNNEPNKGVGLTVEEVGIGIRNRESGDKFSYSVADPSIFSRDGGESMAERFKKLEIQFLPADNSRIAGWENMRSRLRGIDEVPRLYFFSTCVHSIRTIPILQHDTGRPEDINTDGEDHLADMIRYMCMSRPSNIRNTEDFKIKTHTNTPISEIFGYKFK